MEWQTNALKFLQNPLKRNQKEGQHGAKNDPKMIKRVTPKKDKKQRFTKSDKSGNENSRLLFAPSFMDHGEG